MTDTEKEEVAFALDSIVRKKASPEFDAQLSMPEPVRLEDLGDLPDSDEDDVDVSKSN